MMVDIQITRGQIQALAREAGAHGDSAMVEICQRALDGDEDAQTICEDAINAAQAMIEEDER